MRSLNKRRMIIGTMHVLIILFLYAMVSGCQGDGDTIDDQIQHIAFEIVVLGEDQREGTVFEPGTDISVALKLINHSGKEFEWEYGYECQLFQEERFLLVYGRHEGETNGDYIPIGSPYQSPVYCLMINIPPQYFPPGETTVVSRAWSSNPDNGLLSAGKYYIVADVALNIKGRSRNWDLRTDFEM